MQQQKELETEECEEFNYNSKIDYPKGKRARERTA